MSKGFALCRSMKLEVAKAQGWYYDPQSEFVSDEEILMLEKENVFEAFDGDRYVKIVNKSSWSPDNYGASAIGNENIKCKPERENSKIIEIHYDHCSYDLIYFNLDKGSGTRENIREENFAPYQSYNPKQEYFSSEKMTIPGTTIQCRWEAGVTQDISKGCHLEPWLEYPKNGKPLEVARDSKAPKHASDVVKASIRSWRPIRVEIDKELPKGIFEVPDDAKNFPPPEGGNVAY